MSIIRRRRATSRPYPPSLELQIEDTIEQIARNKRMKTEMEDDHETYPKPLQPFQVECYHQISADIDFLYEKLELLEKKLKEQNTQPSNQ